MQVNLDKWHHCNVDKQEFVKLLQKSDYQGFKHMFIFFGSLVFFWIFSLCYLGDLVDCFILIYLWKYMELCGSDMA